MAKLPRRTMSMAKRAVKLAEDAADVDAIEAIAGAPSHEHIGLFAFTGAWLAAVAGIIVLAFALQLVCSRSGAPDFSPPGPLSRGDSAQGSAGDRAAFYHEGDGQRGRSPFPKPDTVDPDIIEVVCPPGTVHISTGPDAADSLCVKGELAGLPASPTASPTASPSPTATPTVQLPSALPDAGQGQGQSSIGATLVPFGLHCAEDEIIGFDASAPPGPEGLPIGCVHVDTFCPVGQHVGASGRCEP